MNEDKLKEAMNKFDQKTKDRLAGKIADFADEISLSKNQISYLKLLKVVCPISLLICGPLVGVLYSKANEGADLFFLGMSIIPTLFLIIIAIIINILIKIPE